MYTSPQSSSLILSPKKEHITMDYGRLGPSDLGGSSRLNSLRSSGRKKIVLLSLFAVLLIVVSAVTAVAVRSHTKNTKADGTSLEKFTQAISSEINHFLALSLSRGIWKRRVRRINTHLSLLSLSLWEEESKRSNTEQNHRTHLEPPMLLSSGTKNRSATRATPPRPETVPLHTCPSRMGVAPPL